jgi:hypothetical protein
MSPTNPIDDIFSSSKKPTRHVVPKTTEPAASSKQAQESSKKKRKRKAEPEAAGNDSDDAPPAKTAKRQPDVVVVDATAVSAVKLANKMSSKPPKATKTAPKQDADSDEEKFKDSRGTGPRTFYNSHIHHSFRIRHDVRTADRRRVSNFQRGRAGHRPRGRRHT